MRNEAVQRRENVETRGTTVLNFFDLCGRYNINPLAENASASIAQFVAGGMVARKKRTKAEVAKAQESGLPEAAQWDYIVRDQSSSASSSTATSTTYAVTQDC